MKITYFLNLFALVSVLTKLEGAVIEMTGGLCNETCQSSLYYVIVLVGDFEKIQ